MLIRCLSRMFVVGLLALGASGCGFFLVKGPPPAPIEAVTLRCTDSLALPSLDVVGAALNAAVVILMALDASYVHRGSNIATSGGALVVLGLSTNSGYRKVRECRAAQDLRARQNSQDDGANGGLAVLPTDLTELPRGPLPRRQSFP